MILGIDPGKSGGCALLDPEGRVLWHITFKVSTLSTICEFLTNDPIEFAMIENVHAMPGQGVTSMFTFGENYGQWQGALTALKIPFDRVYPMKWQTYMGCRTKGNKNISKQRAQELFPMIDVTHAIADALLIAEYARRTRR